MMITSSGMWPNDLNPVGLSGQNQNDPALRDYYY